MELKQIGQSAYGGVRNASMSLFVRLLAPGCRAGAGRACERGWDWSFFSWFVAGTEVEEDGAEDASPFSPCADLGFTFMFVCRPRAVLRGAPRARAFPWKGSPRLFGCLSLSPWPLCPLCPDADAAADGDERPDALPDVCVCWAPFWGGRGRSRRDVFMRLCLGSLLLPDSSATCEERAGASCLTSPALEVDCPPLGSLRPLRSG